MYEVELKVRADHDRVRDRLRELEATPLRAVVQEDTYYDAPDRSFADTDEALRIRRESPGSFSDAGTVGRDDDRNRDDPADDDGGVTRIAYKGPRVDGETKTREEHETTVGDDDRMAAILRSLGYDPVATVRKERAVYGLRGFEVTLDWVDGLGEFLEVDAEVGQAAVDETRDRARDLLGELGLDADEGIRRSYLGMLLERR